MFLLFSFENAIYKKIRVLKRWEPVATKSVTDSILFAIV